MLRRLFLQMPAVLGAGLLGSSAFAQSGLTAVPGTAVRLIPPASFSRAERFPGFQDLATGASIMVTEIPGPFAEVTGGMTPTNLAARGMTQTSRDDVTVSGRPAILLGLTQTAQGVAFQKWMLALGTPAATVLVTATVPVAHAGTLNAPLRRSLLSVVWTPGTPGAVDLAGLPFRLEAPASFGIASRVGNNLILTLGAQPIPRPDGEPFIVVGAAMSRVEVADRDAFAERRVRQTAGVTDITPAPGAELFVAGHPAHELTATARDAEGGDAVLIYQAIVFHDGGYTLVQSLLSPNTAERFLPELRALTRSLTFPG